MFFPTTTSSLSICLNRISRLAQRATSKIGTERARLQNSHPNAQRLNFLLERFRGGFESGLRRRIKARTWSRTLPGNRRNIDKRTAAAIPHSARHCVDHAHRSSVVRRDELSSLI